MKRLPSWVISANAAGSDFPLNNLPYGVASIDGGQPFCCVAIGNRVLNLAGMQAAGFVDAKASLQAGSWNAFMALGKNDWHILRLSLTTLLTDGALMQSETEKYMLELSKLEMHMPFHVAEFTDFYSSKDHATNVGTMFRGAENALPPNWLHIPIGYNGRASSVVVSGTSVRRPWGQVKGPDETVPRYAPSARFDIELELGAIVGQSSNGPISVDQAYENIFGYVLLNDWSARDIQAWEYQPLGPFQSKATATSISPWIVTKAALEPFRVSTPAREKQLLPHLRDTTAMLYDIKLDVGLAPQGQSETIIARTNYSAMYYSAAQQLAHHTSSGCPMRVGDLLGSGTISGSSKKSSGSLLELSWGGKEPFTLDTGESRSFIEDGDTLTFYGYATAKDYRIGFGSCAGKLIPATHADRVKDNTKSHN